MVVILFFVKSLNSYKILLVDQKHQISVTTSKSWTQTLVQTLKKLGPEKPGPRKTCTQKNLDPEKPGLRKTWTLKNLDLEKPIL